MASKNEPVAEDTIQQNRGDEETTLNSMKHSDSTEKSIYNPNTNNQDISISTTNPNKDEKDDSEFKMTDTSVPQSPTEENTTLENSPSDGSSDFKDQSLRFSQTSEKDANGNSPDAKDESFEDGVSSSNCNLKGGSLRRPKMLMGLSRNRLSMGDFTSSFDNVPSSPTNIVDLAIQEVEELQLRHSASYILPPSLEKQPSWNSSSSSSMILSGAFSARTSSEQIQLTSSASSVDLRSSSVGSTGSAVPINVNEVYENCSKVFAEILQTEKDYVQDLENIVKHFMEPMHERSSLRDPVPNVDVLSQEIFSNIQDLLKVNSVILDKLLKIHKHELNLFEFCDVLANVFISSGEDLLVYTRYGVDSSRSSSALAKLERVPVFVQFFEEKRQELNKLDIRDFLIKPIQRITKYPLFFKELLKIHPNHDGFQTALTRVMSVAKYINKTKGQLENTAKLQELERNLEDYPEILALPGRKFIREGQLTKISKGKENTAVQLILFNDIIIVAKVKNAKKRQFQFTEALPLNMCAVSAYETKDGKNNCIQLMILNTRREYILACVNDIDRDRWVKDIERRIEKIREKAPTNQNQLWEEINNITDSLKLFVQKQLANMNSKLEEESKKRKQLETENGVLRDDIRTLTRKVEELEASTRADRENYTQTLQKEIKIVSNNMDVMKKLFLQLAPIGLSGPDPGHANGPTPMAQPQSNSPDPSRKSAFFPRVPSNTHSTQASAAATTSPPTPHSTVSTPSTNVAPTTQVRTNTNPAAPTSSGPQPILVFRSNSKDESTLSHSISKDNSQNSANSTTTWTASPPLSHHNPNNANNNSTVSTSPPSASEPSDDEVNSFYDVNKKPRHKPTGTTVGSKIISITNSIALGKSRASRIGSEPNSPKTSRESVMSESGISPTDKGGHFSEDDDGNISDGSSGDEDTSKSKRALSFDENKTVLKVGYLCKKGFNRRNWTRRYFYLQSDVIVYKKNPKDPKPKGVIPLSHDTKVKVSDRKSSYCFSITTEQREYFIMAGNLLERMQWMEAIGSCITNLGIPVSRDSILDRLI